MESDICDLSIFIQRDTLLLHEKMQYYDAIYPETHIYIHIKGYIAVFIIEYYVVVQLHIYSILLFILTEYIHRLLSHGKNSNNYNK